MSKEEITCDVCEVDFPPESYGDNLEQVEQTIQTVIESIFRDADGLIRGSVNGKTMKPLKPEEVVDRPGGIGTFAEPANMPRKYKPVWMNYENALMSSGKYLVTMVKKYSVTKDETILDNARRTFNAIQTLWNNVAETHGYGRGWMPKPYGGVHDVEEMMGSSVDQYADVTFGLEDFYHNGATCSERTIIEEMVLSFADWMIEYNYTFEHMGNMLRWGTGPCNPPLSCSSFLYIHALAFSFSPQKKYQDGFDFWKEQTRKLFYMPGKGVVGTAFQVLENMERLVVLRPEFSSVWKRAAEVAFEFIVDANNSDQLNTSDDSLEYMAIQWNTTFAPPVFCIADKMFPNKNYGKRALENLHACTMRKDFYQVVRGLPIAKLLPTLVGDDYLNMIWAEGHICWLMGYWRIKGVESEVS